MRVVLSGIFFAFVIVGGYFVVTRLPWVTVYKGCFETAYTTINEAHSITRHAWVSDEQICAEHKKTLLSSLQCFSDAQAKQPLSLLEKDIIITLAQNLAKGTMTMDQMVSDHNKRCTYRKTVLEYDPRTSSWF